LDSKNYETTPSYYDIFKNNYLILEKHNKIVTGLTYRIFENDYLREIGAWNFICSNMQNSDKEIINS
jgi:hypothetical protein